MINVCMNYVLLFRLTLVIDMKISYPTQGGVKLFNELPEKMKSMKKFKTQFKFCLAAEDCIVCM